jgi:hypothetical protein
MFDVVCPKCGELRQVKAKKTWMQGFPPFENLCKKCCQEGKSKTEEHKRKLSESQKLAQTEERRKELSEYRKAHPETWQDNLVAGAGAGWNEGLETGPLSEEVKDKISETLKQTKKKEGTDES